MSENIPNGYIRLPGYHRFEPERTDIPRFQILELMTVGSGQKKAVVAISAQAEISQGIMKHGRISAKGLCIVGLRCLFRGLLAMIKPTRAG